MRFESDFAHGEVAEMLVRALRELERPVRLSRLKDQIGEWLRLLLVRYKFEPARLRFSKSPGWYVRQWQKNQGVRR